MRKIYDDPLETKYESGEVWERLRKVDGEKKVDMNEIAKGKTPKERWKMLEEQINAQQDLHES